jgi:DNA-binding transcriptional ArsR family regulator
MDDFYTFLETKTERLVTALYMITNFFPEREPMKWRLRDEGLRLLSRTASLKDIKLSKRAEAMNGALSNISETISLLDIARLADFISEMNYSMLKREYESLRDMVAMRAEVGESENNFALPDDFFKTGLPAPIERRGMHGGISEGRMSKRSATAPSETHYEKRVERVGFHPVSTHTHATQTPAQSAITAPTTQQNIDQKDAVRSTTQYSPVSKTEIKKDKRRTQILGALRDKSDLTIKDIAHSVEGCSEKTIQRELVDLVNEGVVKRKGERRWSRYTLVA